MLGFASFMASPGRECLPACSSSVTGTTGCTMASPGLCKKHSPNIGQRWVSGGGGGGRGAAGLVAAPPLPVVLLRPHTSLAAAAAGRACHSAQCARAAGARGSPCHCWQGRTHQSSQTHQQQSPAAKLGRGLKLNGGCGQRRASGAAELWRRPPPQLLLEYMASLARLIGSLTWVPAPICMQYVHLQLCPVAWLLWLRRLVRRPTPPGAGTPLPNVLSCSVVTAAEDSCDMAAPNQTARMNGSDQAGWGCR